MQGAGRISQGAKWQRGEKVIMFILVVHKSSTVSLDFGHWALREPCFYHELALKM